VNNKRAVFVLNDFEADRYPIEKIKGLMAQNVRIDLVYTIPDFPPAFNALPEFFRIFTSVTFNAKSELRHLNAALGLPVSQLHILSPRATKFLCKCAEAPKTRMVTKLRDRVSSVLGKWPLVRLG
jgi:hypothetical protein